MTENQKNETIIMILSVVLVVSLAINFFQYQDFLKISEEKDRYESYITKYPYLELFRKPMPPMNETILPNFTNQTTYCVAESKELWLNGKLPLLFESTSSSEAYQWATDHISGELDLLRRGS